MDPLRSRRRAAVQAACVLVLAAPSAFARAPIASGALARAPAAPVAPHAAAQDAPHAGVQDAPHAPVQDANELAQLLSEERREADLLRRRGELRAALRRCDELLDDDAADVESRTLRASCLFDQADYAHALEEAQRAVQDLPKLAETKASPDTGALAQRALRGLCVRNLARIELALGDARKSVELLHAHEVDLDARRDARDAWVQGSALLEVGERDDGLRQLELGAQTADQQAWDALLARGACQQRLGRIEQASQSLVLADAVAKAGQGVEPDVLAALGDLYFEADREVESAQRRSAASLYKEALTQNPIHEPALLGLFRLHRYNWMRKSRSAQEILDQLEAARPASIEGLIAGTAADLDDGQLKSARERLAKLQALAPARRDVRTLVAALAWIEHRNDDCEALLAELAQQDPKDSAPERKIGRHLLELYRFAEGLPFEQRAVARDEHDFEAWTELGRALANTGDEEGARAALDRAQKEAGLRQDAWRDNLRLVLKNMAAEQKREVAGELTFAWNPDAAEVLRAYLVPFYTGARAELAQRYGFTPGPTLIEVFRRHRDFSVRSTGFEGFPALGVCFGPVVTAVSPLEANLRGTNSWARTSFHEFTHVIHLGLSHNRCPRWITEGLATWEEVHRNPAWSRNMRRELVDARANGDIIPVRDLNRAFRGPRILFGYYQGGLLCQLLIERDGFAPMIRLLEAFDRGLDLDQALSEVYHTTPERLDQDFADFVARLTAGLAIEPRWNPAHASAQRLALAQKPPEDPAQLASWADGWCTVAWSAWQSGRKVDAQEALRIIRTLDPQPARAEFLRGELALFADDRAEARKIWEQVLAGGHEDFRVRIALGSIARDAREFEVAEQHFLAAEKDFPGFDQEDLCAELNLDKLYTALGRNDDALAARERWLAFNAGDVQRHRSVALWHAEAGRAEQSLKYFEETNDIDPFLRQLHVDWGKALRATGRHAQALREFRVALAVPQALDGDKPAELTKEEQAELIALQAASLAALTRNAEALETARKALELDPGCALARETLEKLQ